MWIHPPFRQLSKGILVCAKLENESNNRTTITRGVQLWVGGTIGSELSFSSGNMERQGPGAFWLGGLWCRGFKGKRMQEPRQDSVYQWKGQNSYPPGSLALSLSRIWSVAVEDWVGYSLSREGTLIPGSNSTDRLHSAEQNSLKELFEFFNFFPPICPWTCSSQALTPLLLWNSSHGHQWPTCLLNPMVIFQTLS